MFLRTFAALAVAVAMGGQAMAQAPQPFDGDQASARWTRRICAGVTGITGANAQFVVDRISQRATELGLRVGEPGCTANVLIVFSADPDGQAQRTLSERTDPVSAAGRGGRTRGLEALQADFVTTDAAVRWWHVTRSMTQTGETALRNDRFGEPARVNVPEVGRLGSTTFESMSHVVVIVDLRQVNGLRLGALSDYLAFVALAQVAPASAQGQDSILNLFTDRAAGRAPAEGLTTWDNAYLRGIYGAG